MPDQLRPDETRVLGVLIEKSLAQPAYYPMTLSAITAACNQKSNRDPVTNYSESDVGDALATLRKKELVTQAEPDRGSRAVRFRHEVEARLGWNAAQRAIMAELMLRGPQTLAELRTRASRMTHLESQDYTRDLLRELESAASPFVVELPREQGKTSRRFAHLLGGATRAASPGATAPDSASGQPMPSASSSLAAASQGATGPDSASGLPVPNAERATTNAQGATGSLLPVPNTSPGATGGLPPVPNAEHATANAQRATGGLPPVPNTSWSTSDVSTRLLLLEEQVANIQASLADLRETLRQSGIQT